MVHSLSGKYFNIVLGWYSGLIRNPLILSVNPESIKVVGEPLGFKLEGPAQVIRVILESGSNRHSNVLIVDHVLKRIVRFEPAMDSDPRINQELITILRPNFRGYDFVESSSHPQVHDRTLCVAYSLRFARDYIMRNGGLTGGNEDIHEFVRSIKSLYQLPKDVEDTDRETGPGGFGVGVGLLGGLAIGSLAGAAIAGAASPRPYYYYPAPPVVTGPVYYS